MPWASPLNDEIYDEKKNFQSAITITNSFWRMIYTSRETNKRYKYRKIILFYRYCFGQEPITL